MRITNGVLVNNLKKNISNNIRAMDKLQTQLATGKQISKPSDNPAGIVDSLRLSTHIKENKQFQENVEDAVSFLETTDEVLGSLTNVLNRAYELSVYGANSTMAPEDRQAIAEEMKQLLEEAKAVANTSLGDKYLFGGSNTTVEPYDGTDWHDDNRTFYYEIGKDIVIPVNVTAEEVFKEKDMFGVLKETAQHLDDNEIGMISSNDIERIQENIDQVLALRSKVGARVNRLELSLSRLKEQEINFTKLQANVDGVDPAMAILELKNQENVYNASLAVGARVIMPSLVDFLR